MKSRVFLSLALLNLVGCLAPNDPSRKVSLDVASLNNLSVPPWQVVQNYRKIKGRHDLRPEIECLCLMAQIAEIKSERGYGSKNPKDRKQYNRRLKPFYRRLRSIQSFRTVRVRTLDYITNVPASAMLGDEGFRRIYIDALKEKAKLGLLSLDHAKSLVHFLFCDKSASQRGPLAFRLAVRTSSSTEREAIGYPIPAGYIHSILQALGDSQHPEIIQEIVSCLSDNPDDAPYGTDLCLEWLLRDAARILDTKTASKADWSRLVRDLKGRLVWEGTDAVEFNGPFGSGHGDSEQSFYRISWSALYLDKEVWMATGHFRDRLTTEEEKRLSAFRKLDKESQKKLAIETYLKANTTPATTAMEPAETKSSTVVPTEK